MEIPAIEGVRDWAPGNGRWVKWENVMPEGMEHVDFVGHPERVLEKRPRPASGPARIAENALLADRLGLGE